MRVGILEVSPELMSDRDWPVIEKTLALHFKETARRYNTWSNVWELIGTSPEFDELQEGQKPPVYFAVFQNIINGLPMFLEFQKRI